MTPRVLLATAASLPVDDQETPRIVAALSALGITSAIAPWGDPDVDWGGAEAVVVRSTWDYTDRVDEFLSWADTVAATTALWNPAPVLRWNAHKGYLVELAAAGVPVVPTTLVPIGADAEAIDAALSSDELGAGPMVVKPAVDAGARGARRADASDEQLRAHALALAEVADVLVQPYVPAIADEGELTLVLLWGAPLLARRKLPAHGDFRVQEHHGGRTLAIPLDDELVDIAAAALAQVGGPLLYARVDVVRYEGRLHLMELELIEPFLYLDADDEVRSTAEAIATTIG